MKPTEYTYKNKATWVYNNLLDAFTNDERQDKRKETRDTRKNQRQGRRDIATTGPEGTPRMSQPQFKQDRQAVFDENVEAFEKKASRKAKAEGGISLDALETIEVLLANGKIEAALKEEIKEEKNDSKKNNLQTLLERIQSGEIDATNIREDMGARKKKAKGFEVDLTEGLTPQELKALKNTMKGFEVDLTEGLTTRELQVIKNNAEKMDATLQYEKKKKRKFPNPHKFTEEQKQEFLKKGYKLIKSGRNAGTYSSDGVDYSPPMDETWAGLSEKESNKRRELDYHLIINNLKPTDGMPLSLREKGFTNRADKLKLEIINNIFKKNRDKKAEGGDIDAQMETLMPTEEMHSMPDGTKMPGATHEEYEATMSTDEDMEDGYLDFILDEALEDEEETYLMEQLESNDKLSLIFDKVIDVATEFAGSGPVNGPGSGVSDSIPARLSDGEFVFTAKATEELGADNLEAIMREAETQAEGRQQAAIGGYINVDRDDDTQIPIQTTESAKAQSNVQPVNRRKTVEQLEEEMLKSNPRRRYAVISG